MGTQSARSLLTPVCVPPAVMGVVRIKSAVAHYKTTCQIQLYRVQPATGPCDRAGTCQ